MSVLSRQTLPSRCTRIMLCYFLSLLWSHSCTPQYSNETEQREREDKDVYAAALQTIRDVRMPEPARRPGSGNPGCWTKKQLEPCDAQPGGLQGSELPAMLEADITALTAKVHKVKAKGDFYFGFDGKCSWSVAGVCVKECRMWEPHVTGQAGPQPPQGQTAIRLYKQYLQASVQFTDLVFCLYTRSLFWRKSGLRPVYFTSRMYFSKEKLGACRIDNFYQQLQRKFIMDE